MKSSEYKLLAARMSKKLTLAVALVMLLIGLGIQPAISALTGHSPEVDPNHKFPIWFSDSTTILQLCLDPAMCTPDPVIGSNITSINSGFGAEAFWWSADAGINFAGGGRALLVLALEAAYGAGDPAPNDQLAFGRVRIRIDAPADGEYKVWHPYLGATCEPEVFNVTAGIKAINVTRDIGGGAPFDAALASEVGPFLVWDPAVAPAAPAGFVGDPTIPHEVINGRCDVNYFKIEGPAGVNLDGSGSNVVQTFLFSVQGQIFNGVVPPSLQPVRATYLRSTNPTTHVTTSRINTWVKAPTDATVTLLNPQTSANVVMKFNNVVDSWFGRIGLNEGNSIPMPTQVTVTATNPSGSTSLVVGVTDKVDIQVASWSASTQRLRVVAVSSDKIAATEDAQPVLTLFGASTVPVEIPQVGAAGRYEATLTGIAVPPAQVTVTSSKGGSDTEKVAD